jgi:hypothetical protein
VFEASGYPQAEGFGRQGPLAFVAVAVGVTVGVTVGVAVTVGVGVGVGVELVSVGVGLAGGVLDGAWEAGGTSAARDAASAEALAKWPFRSSSRPCAVDGAEVAEEEGPAAA